MYIHERRRVPESSPELQAAHLIPSYTADKSSKRRRTYLNRISAEGSGQFIDTTRCGHFDQICFCG